MNRAAEIIDEILLSVCPDLDHLRGRRERDIGRGIDCSDAPRAGLYHPLLPHHGSRFSNHRFRLTDKFLRSSGWNEIANVCALWLQPWVLRG